MKYKEIIIGTLALLIGLIIGFFSGQEYFEYKIKKDTHKVAKQITEELGESNQQKINEVKPPPMAIKKEVPFDPSRMENEGYLQLKWGMNQQEVQDLTGCYITDEEYAHIEDRIANEKSMVYFRFIEYKLYMVVISILLDTMNNDKYITKFKELEKLLIDKYGKPKEIKKWGSRNPYISDSMAISMGNGLYRTKWETEQSKIWLILSGDKTKMRLSISYDSKKYSPLAEKLDKQKSKGKL